MAASTCSQTPCASQVSPIASRSSNAPVASAPAVATTAITRRPASSCPRNRASSERASIRWSRSPTVTSRELPRPSAASARATLKWTFSPASTTGRSQAASPSSHACGSARARAARSAVKFDSVAPEVKVPPAPSPQPISRAIQPTSAVSSAVPVGDIDHMRSDWFIAPMSDSHQALAGSGDGTGAHR
jgi:hypothetical protein